MPYLMLFKSYNKLLIEYLLVLEGLHIIIFSAYIEKDYFNYRTAHEKKIIQQTEVLMKIFCQLRRRYQEELFAQQSVSEEFISRLEHLYEIMFSLDLLKYRLVDHATFEVCHSELKIISQVISTMILDLINVVKYQNTAKLKVCERITLAPAIQAFEIIFHSTLQFITADPMFFLFFIRDLNALNEELLSIKDEFNAKNTNS